MILNDKFKVECMQIENKKNDNTRARDLVLDTKLDCHNPLLHLKLLILFEDDNIFHTSKRNPVTYFVNVKKNYSTEW